MNIGRVDAARADDAEEISRLVNLAYRPTSGTSGWTHESSLVSGPRIDTRQVLDALAQPATVILVARSGGRINACVQLQRSDKTCLLGMLAVDPSVQGTGAGTKMLDIAERYALEVFGCMTIRISVLTQRPELIAFYRRRGYQPTGALSDYPRHAGVGLPIVEGLTIETLDKPVAP